MLSKEEDAEIRLAIFEWLDLRGQDWITKTELETGFSFKGKTLRLIASQQGIWRPASTFQMRGVLSVVSKPNGPYEDLALDENRTVYKYMGTDPNHASNRALRQSYEEGIPFIFLRWLKPGVYLPLYQAYAVESNPEKLEVVIDYGLSPQTKGSGPYVPEEIAREYELRMVRQRVHQSKFRTQVIFAYKERCAICHLNHPELLDAAHIVPDKHELGVASVRNGLSLCKIHHTAYDKDFLGISPELKVRVNAKLLAEKDGPMLRHGIQDMHGSTINTPDQAKEKPDPELLDLRFQKFLEKA